MEWIKDEYTLTDDLSKVDIDVVYQLLKETYWAHRRSYDVVTRLTEHSLCFTLLCQNDQIGFGRAVSDYTVFSWIADVVIHPEYRGEGLGKWMMSCIIEHPKIAHTQIALQTKDAHSFYEKYNFTSSPALMSRKPE